MKLHVQCDRCQKYVEATPAGGSWPEQVMAPDGWFHLRAFAEPIRVDRNYGLPEGALVALLCGDCMPPVQRAVEAAITALRPRVLPTVAELEALLESEDGAAIEILIDGSVRAVPVEQAGKT